MGVTHIMVIYLSVAIVACSVCYWYDKKESGYIGTIIAWPLAVVGFLCAFVVYAIIEVVAIIRREWE